MDNIAQAIKDISKDHIFFKECGDYKESDRIKVVVEISLFFSGRIFYLLNRNKSEKINEYKYFKH